MEETSEFHKQQIDWAANISERRTEEQRVKWYVAFLQNIQGFDSKEEAEQFIRDTGKFFQCALIGPVQ